MAATTSKEAPLSLRELTHRTLVGMIQSVEKQGASKYKILVLDEASTRVLSASCRMYDVMAHGITLCEALAKKRQPFPALDAIYFVSPTKLSAELIAADFGDNKIYAGAHIFFTSRASDEVVETLAKSRAAPFIRNLAEANVDYLSPEANVFHCDMKQTSILPPADRDSAVQLSAQIATVCATLGEIPFVRHQGTEVTRAVAIALDDCLRKLEKANAIKDSGRPRATVLIVDRTIDLVAPLLHEFTYQAMVYDLLDVKNDVYQYVTTDAKGDKQVKDVIVGEHDSLWRAYRHKHIQETLVQVPDDFNRFMRTNKAAVRERGEKKEVTATTTKEMADVISAMPQFLELKEKYSLHTHMTQECMTKYRHKGLSKLALVEQEMVTGQTEQGEKSSAKRLVTNIVAQITSPTTMAEERVRLLALFAATQKTKEADRKVLMDKAALGTGDRRVVELLAALSERDSFRDRLKEHNARPRDDPDPILVSRYVPIITNVIRDQLQGTLKWPYEGREPGASESAAGSAAAAAADVGAAGLKKKKGKAVDAASDAALLAATAPRLIVFMCGGVAYNEIRATYQIGALLNREVVIGGTELLPPRRFLEQASESMAQ